MPTHHTNRQLPGQPHHQRTPGTGAQKEVSQDALHRLRCPEAEDERVDLDAATPRRAAWTRELRRLGAIHGVRLMVPADAITDAATRLGVSPATVAYRFAGFVRTLARTERVRCDAGVLVEAVAAPDFQAAASLLRARGTMASSFALEALLRSAPGPAASALRAREARRRSAAKAPTGVTETAGGDR